MTVQSLAISYESARVYPHAMHEVIVAASKQIRKRISEAPGEDPYQPLRPSQEPFKVHQWGLVIEAKSSEGRHLTWKLLLDTMEGLLLCALDRGHRNLLKAQIRVGFDQQPVTMGWVELKVANNRDVARRS
ncbi:MAG: hypothetical protein Q9186_005058 [Xanthomendoza sp. 1 TL-2023]